jgi:hypothetical protein
MSVDEQAPAPDRKAIKAEAAAAKARAKASRPWYQKKRFILPLGILLLVVIISVSSGGGGDVDETEPAASDTADAAAAVDEAAEDEAAEDEAAEDLPEDASADAESARIGEEVRDGKFAFTVNSFECVGNTLEPRDEFLDAAQAQGQFCILALSVENIGDAAQSLSSTDQYLYDDQERRYSASSDFDVMMAIDTPIYDSINPGNSMDGTIVFDVPEGAVIEFAELHDSAFSGGIMVDLR